jgi:hypothetical protein
MRAPFGAVLALPTTRVAMALAGLLGLALCGVRLLGLWGQESALLLGVLLPPFAAAIGARLVVACRRSGDPEDANQVVCAAVSASACMLAIPVLLLGINALLVRNCAPLEGLAFIMLGPGFGVLFAALVGVTVSAAIPWPAIATIVAVMVPVSALCVSAYSLYSTPAVFAYGQFFGFYHGSLYDEDVSIPLPLLLLRTTNVIMGIGLMALFAGFYQRERHRLSVRSGIPRSTCFLTWAVLALSSGVFTEVYGEQLGLRTSA